MHWVIHLGDSLLLGKSDDCPATISLRLVVDVYCAYRSPGRPFDCNHHRLWSGHNGDGIWLNPAGKCILWVNHFSGSTILMDDLEYNDCLESFQEDVQIAWLDNHSRLPMVTSTSAGHFAVVLNHPYLPLDADVNDVQCRNTLNTKGQLNEMLYHYLQWCVSVKSITLIQHELCAKNENIRSVTILFPKVYMYIEIYSI